MDGASIPDFSGVVEAPASEDQVIALWELLGRDPMFELRELAATSQQGVPSPAQIEKKKTFVTRLRSLDRVAAVLSLVEPQALATPWQHAVPKVSNDATLKAALSANNVATPLRVAAARAVVAVLQQELVDGNMPVPGDDLRDALVEACVSHLGGRELGVKDWIASKLVGFGLRWATEKARRKRDALFNAASPAAGDVLLYQTRGAAIREFIAQRITESGEDVAIIAHSLGGIACVDVLVERHLPHVKLLVTVGSQAPLLYELGALWSRPFGEPLPDHFPKRWVNFFDRNDLLSYTAAPVFKTRAVDYEINSGQPFPQTHSAYWSNPVLWEKLAPHLMDA